MGPGVNWWWMTQRLTLAGKGTCLKMEGHERCNVARGSWSQSERAPSVSWENTNGAPEGRELKGATPWPCSSAFPPIFHHSFPRAKPISHLEGQGAWEMPFLSAWSWGKGGLEPIYSCKRKRPIRSACHVLPNMEYSILRAGELSPGNFWKINR